VVLPGCLILEMGVVALAVRQLPEETGQCRLASVRLVAVRQPPTASRGKRAIDQETWHAAQASRGSRASRGRR